MSDQLCYFFFYNGKFKPLAVKNDNVNKTFPSSENNDKSKIIKFKKYFINVVVFRFLDVRSANPPIKW